MTFHMASQFIFLLFVLTPCLAQIVDDDDDLDSPVFDWLQFSKGTENDYVDDLDQLEDEDEEESLDIRDRSLGSHDLPYNVTCELRIEKVHSEGYLAFSAHPKENITCVEVPNVNPLTYSRYHPKKEFCIIKHQTHHREHKLCKTEYINIRIKDENYRFGIGCACHRSIKWNKPHIRKHIH